MKRFGIRLLIALSTFIVGVGVAMIWILNRTSQHPIIPVIESKIDNPLPRATPDDTIYAVPFCELISDPHRYDRKLVRTQAIFVNGIDTAALTNDSCGGDDAWIRPIGAIEPEDKLLESRSGDKLSVAIENLVHEGRFPLEAKVDFVGRFYAYGEDGRNHQLVMLDVKDAEPARRRR